MAKATIQQLQAQLDEIQALLAKAGITLPVEPAADPKDRVDYIEFGSPEHAAFLGLVKVEEAESERLTYTSPKTGDIYALEDEVTPFMGYPDPKQVAELVLRQKVSSFESGPPPIPEGAPPMWIPREYVPA